MKITIHTVTYNEELLMQLMIDHYRKRFPDCHIVVYDNQSTDNTVSIAKNNNCEIRHYDSGRQVNDQMLWETKNTCWKNAQTDWVLVCDLDEMLDITAEQLRAEDVKGVTKIKCECYHMVNMENNLDVKNITYGLRDIKDTVYDKDLLFNKKYVDINYINNDCHFTNSIAKGKPIKNSSPYKMYHYKYVNPDIFVEKQKTSARRLSEINKINGWGAQCLRDENNLRNEFQSVRDRAIKLFNNPRIKKDTDIEHFYQNIYGWFNCEGLYSNIINNLPNNANIVEIGAYKGKSTAYLVVEAINSGKNININIIDSWNGDNETQGAWSDYIAEPDKNQLKPDGDIFEEFKNNLMPVWGKFNPIQSLSAPAASSFEDKSLDFIFIDGDHQYEGIKKDLISWRPKMKDGAIMAGDDYNPSWGVIRAVDEFFGKNTVKVIGSQWMVQL